MQSDKIAHCPHPGCSNVTEYQRVVDEDGTARAHVDTVRCPMCKSQDSEHLAVCEDARLWTPCDTPNCLSIGCNRCVTPCPACDEGICFVCAEDRAAVRKCVQCHRRVHIHKFCSVVLRGERFCRSCGPLSAFEETA